MFITVDKNMHSQETCFTSFEASVDEYTLPERFTFPFYYEPHPLCLLAANELQQYLETQTEWQHNFGLTGDADSAVGKMFGVLLVQKLTGGVGYLAAYSGKVADSNHLAHFVPPVYDMLSEESFFLSEQDEINSINQQIKTLQAAPKLAELKTAAMAATDSAAEQIEAHRQQMIEGRKSRKEQRAHIESTMTPEEAKPHLIQLSRESVQEKNQLRELKELWEERIHEAKQQLAVLTHEIESRKQARKTLSSGLQKKLFDQYRFLNTHGDEKNLNDIFNNATNPIPPAGSGECAAPKLLHYAFKWGMKPLALAEFWWGVAPKSEIRQHKKFYAACQSKCEPILGHMLQDLPMDENPLLINPAEGKDIEIIYQDDDILIINKPADFLSVPGKNIKDSVYLRVKQKFPEATGPLIVHRLDMATSGLMVIALTPRANKSLQKQFITRAIQKRYVAMLSGVLQDEQGLVDLPMRGDPDDRPRQLVCHEHGKPAETTWQVIEKKGSQTKVYLYPKTGRTHQLRVHCAHTQGLQMPIVGDDLYGLKSDRLHLHAEQLSLSHPITKEQMTFQVDAEF